MNIEIIDNFLDNREFALVQNQILVSNSFPWYFNQIHQDSDYLYNLQYTHNFFKDDNINSDYFFVLDNVLKRLEPKKIVRIKANSIPITENIVEHPFHIDCDKDCKTAIFYLNNNNGYTVFANGKKVSSIANRMVIFDSAYKHAGTSCTDKKIRCVINLNFFR